MGRVTDCAVRWFGANATPSTCHQTMFLGTGMDGTVQYGADCRNSRDVSKMGQRSGSPQKAGRPLSLINAKWLDSGGVCGVVW